MRSTVALSLTLLLALLVAGCGSTAGDLLAVDRTGDIPGAKLRVVVSDQGMASCNGGRSRLLPDGMLLDARQIEREVEELAKAGTRLAAAPQSVLQYHVHTPDGDVRFADNSARKPQVLDQAAFFTRRVAQQVCGLVR